MDKDNQSHQTLSIIDISPYLENDKNRTAVSEQLRKVCKQTGFFYVTNHGVPSELQQSIIKNAANFFSLPLEVKNQIHLKHGGESMRGYVQIGDQFTSGKLDLKEGLYLGQQLNANHPKVLKGLPLYGPNRFPAQCPQLKKDILGWLQHMSRLGDALLQAIAQSLHLDRYFFREGLCKQHIGSMRIFHYPIDIEKDPSIWAVGQHTDYGLLTILMTSDKGLQAKNRVTGKWISIDPISNTFIINIGDFLQRLTKGLYKSTVHRARNTESKSRFSVPYFYDPDWDAQLGELKIKVSEEEEIIQKETMKLERWDKTNIRTLKGTFGEYLLSKMAKTLPEIKKNKQ